MDGLREAQTGFLARGHLRLVRRANIHFVLAAERNSLYSNAGLSGLEQKVGAGCLALAELFARLSPQIDHEATLRQYPALGDQAITSSDIKSFTE